MSERDRLNKLHDRVIDWSLKAAEEGLDIACLHQDPEFLELIQDLMQEDPDDLVLLMGMNMAAYDDMPDWYKNSEMGKE